MSNISTKEARSIVRQWALDNGVPCASTGAIPERVRQAYVDAYSTEAIAPVLRYEDSTVRVMCPLCANIHQHGAKDSSELGHRINHCHNALAEGANLGYYLTEVTSK